MKPNEMTYGQLYEAASTWLARHVAQDMLFHGKDCSASESDISKVNRMQIEENGEPILETCSICRRVEFEGCPHNHPCE